MVPRASCMLRASIQVGGHRVHSLTPPNLPGMPPRLCENLKRSSRFIQYVAFAWHARPSVVSDHLVHRHASRNLHALGAIFGTIEFTKFSNPGSRKKPNADPENGTVFWPQKAPHMKGLQREGGPFLGRRFWFRRFGQNQTGTATRK